jgi:NAD(P)-dependent dehydrogenase (short-subunit alcohol dehydrogenase family)
LIEYEGKNVMVTGAGSGIGKEIARMFALEGAFVIACDIDQEKVKEAADEIINKNGKAVHMVFDVSQEVQVKNIVSDILEKYGVIDILINAAGIIFLGKIEDISAEIWDRVLAVNLKGTFLVSKEVIPSMKQRKKGCIINITAAAAKTGGMNVGGNYVASKGGISSFTIHLAKHLAPYGIRVNAISPGPIDTPMLAGNSGGGNYNDEMRENIVKSTPLGIGSPEDIAYGALFLADGKRARYITGEILDIDGGLFMD